MRILNLLFSAFVTILLLSGCMAREHFILFQDADDYQDARRISSTYDIRIQADDQLAISIASKDKELVEVFNNKTFIGSQQGMGGSMMSSNSNGNNNLNGFHVDADGNIEFPILGRIYVMGKSRKEVAEDIQERLRQGYVNDAVVNVELLSFHVVVIMGNDGKILNIDRDRCTIVEAITMAGGFKTGTYRENVLVVREENGELWTYRADFTELSKLLNSPVYYLQQNDIIYIETNSAQQVEESSTYRFLTAFSSIMAFVVSIGAILLSVNK
ncbi:MAG: polysaccharide biosynthesis/export family protein [Bacteroidales bacterium]|nr:polysaccharide biosynthesis/export family protein [Bacteroidales bacterium]